jgi:hypothetical protein
MKCTLRCATVKRTLKTMSRRNGPRKLGASFGLRHFRSESVFRSVRIILGLPGQRILLGSAPTGLKINRCKIRTRD